VRVAILRGEALFFLDFLCWTQAGSKLTLCPFLASRQESDKKPGEWTVAEVLASN
jgi:hypothetical protein